MNTTHNTVAEAFRLPDGRLDSDKLHGARAYLKEVNLHYGHTLERLTPDRWPGKFAENCIAIWRSRHFVVMAFQEELGIIRLSIHQTKLDMLGHWIENMTWDQIQALKAQAGFAHLDAIEIYPAAKDEMLADNMRHIWLMPEPFPLTWRNLENSNS